MFFCFFFLWFCEAVGSSSFPSFFFFLNFIFIIFLKKTLLNDFLFYFLKCPILFDKFIWTLFSTKPKSFLYFHFFNLSTKHKWEKLKTFLSSYFSILLLFLFSHFSILLTKRTLKNKKRAWFWIFPVLDRFTTSTICIKKKNLYKFFYNASIFHNKKLG